MDDSALMARVQGGDEAALAELMQRWEIPLKRVIGRLVQNVADAEELAQETFARVWWQRGKFRPGAEFRPWIFAIALNLARNRLRWWRRRPSVSLDEWTEMKSRGDERIRRSPVGIRPHEDALLQTEGGTARLALERSEEAERVRIAVANLPRKLREVVVLFEYEGLSHLEIAQTVGGSAKAVETRLYRARAILRTTLSSTGAL